MIYESEPGQEFSVLRVNLGANSLAGHPLYAYRIGVAVPIVREATENLPDSSDYEALCRIEDLLLDQLERNREGIMVLVLTMSGFREYTFYSRVPDQVPDLIAGLAPRVEPYELQIYVRHDPDWECYRDYLAMCGESDADD